MILSAFFAPVLNSPGAARTSANANPNESEDVVRGGGDAQVGRTGLTVSREPEESARRRINDLRGCFLQVTPCR
jgi:hypothetical protein